MRKSNYLWLLLAAVCGTMLFHTSQQVTDGRTKLAGIEAKAEKEDETIRVLEAEWSYLNQPDRLEKLSRQYLALEPLKGRQFGKIADLEARPAPETPDAAVADANSDVKPATVAAIAESETATVKAQPVAEVTAQKLPPEKVTPEKTEEAKADTQKTDTQKPDDVKIDKASVTAGFASPALTAKTAPAAKPAIKAAVAKPAAQKPLRGYVYSPAHKPYAPAYPAAQAGTYYHAPGVSTPVYSAPVAQSPNYPAPVATSSADSGRGFNDVMKSLGVH